MTGASPLLALSGHALVHCTCPLSEVKQTSLFSRSPLLRSLLGVKRTWLIALQMSAYDPKRKSVD